MSIIYETVYFVPGTSLKPPSHTRLNLIIMKILTDIVICILNGEKNISGS